MLDLMAVNYDDSATPLYIHIVHRILREMRIEQQNTGGSFNYTLFKSMVTKADLTPAQLAPLNQRLSVLESFMPPKATTKKLHGENLGTNWTNEPGLLTIIDLSCPCISPDTACSLFNACLSMFLEQDYHCGRVIALDEAHKVS
ncbi:hypothetical protein NQ176_g9366 [Zarea fungicola]|uniref:Uncharacterized protein n=1 Tax=Zarea fungicola TaxID=93591 RepID=A0ACC1MML6_9HYPO|nr:hypothetical protein NQ176_g9366 [Lecanicillium fungicola]